MKQNLKISKDFTIDDIHKIREWNYYRRLELGATEYKKQSEEEFKEIIKNFPNAIVMPAEEVRKQNLTETK